MQLNGQNLLKALGCTIPQIGSGVNGYCCPLHRNGTPSLRIHENPHSGSVYFECIDPQCLFYGDAVSLVSAAKHITISEAIALFRPSGELASALKEPFLEAEMAAYTESRMAQSRIQAYMCRCQQALRLAPEKLQYRVGISAHNLRMIPAELGLLVKNDDIPAPFKEFNRAKYQRTTHVVYPFTYNAEVTHVRIDDSTSTLAHATITIIRSDLGVFMERFSQDELPTRLLVTFCPRTALRIFSLCKTEAARKPPVIAVAGFPLPESLAGVKSLYLLCTPEAPLTLADALAILASPEVIAGAPVQPTVRVWSRHDELLTAEVIRNRLISDNHLDTLAVWVLQEMDRMVKGNGLEDVFRALSTVTLPDATKAELLQLAKTKGISKEVQEALQTTTTTAVNRIILGNGKLLRRTAVALKAIDSKGNEETLCNVGLLVNHKVKTYNGEAIISCTVTTADTSIPPLTVNITESAWRRGSSIQKLIVKAFAARGQTPYVAFYDLNGYRWEDIFCKLAEQCELHCEVQELGLDESMDIHMPNFVIRMSTRTIEQQKQVFTLPPAALQVYAGVPPSIGVSNMEPFRMLLQRCDNMYVAAFTHGIMHVVYQLTRELYARTRQDVPKHLVYVETEASIWQKIFSQVAMFFSDNEFIPTLNFSEPETTITTYKQLGALPLIARIPPLRSDKFMQTLLNSSTSLLGITDSMTPVFVTGDAHTSFIIPSSDKPEQLSQLDPRDLDELRNSFAGFVLDFATRLQCDSIYRTSDIPSHAAYLEACRMLELEPQPLMRQIIRNHFPSAGMCGVNTFFDVLHRVLNMLYKKPVACVVYGPPPQTASFTARGQHIFVMDDCVVISHTVVELINQESPMTRFNTKVLGHELKEREFLIERPEYLAVDTNRCWIISRRVWDTHIVRPPLLLAERVTNGNVIQLKFTA